jgi:ribosomal protein S18 acetylase RimI-like enzyme
VRVEADRLHDGLRAAFSDLFGRLAGARLEQRTGYRLVVCPSMPFPGLNGLWLDGPDESIGAQEIARAIAEVEAEALPAWIEFRADDVPASEATAREIGFIAEEMTPGMVLRRDEFIVTPPPAVEIVRVRDTERLAVAAEVAAAGFEAPPGIVADLFGPDIAASPGYSFYLAEVDGMPVSTATAWHGVDGVGIFNVATPPAHRGRGYGRAVTARAVEDGFEAGADLAWLQASPLGEPLYHAMGFRSVATYVILGRSAAET